MNSPLLFSKIFYPAALFLLGICAWFCFRKWKLSETACILGAIATTFSSHFFSTACWGVAAQVIGIGMCFIAIGFAGPGTPKRGWRFWVKLILAGLAVGINIMEGYDIGAIFSLFVAGFIFYDSLISEPTPAEGAIRGVIQVAIVALFAAFCAAQALTVLIGTQVKGVTDERTGMTEAQRWDWATQWSMPPRELTRIFIPGLYGYRMDTPGGGAYWGEVGRVPMVDQVIEEYHKQGNEGMPPGIPDGAWRFNGGGEYAGILVLGVALWALAQSFRKNKSVFNVRERKLIWFWAGAALVSLLLATGRYAPFYRLFYMLPHAANIRNASKFMHPFHWSLVILFALGVHGLVKGYFTAAPAAAPSKGSASQKTGWAALSLFDQRWIVFSIGVVGLSLLAWLVYAMNHDNLTKHLMEAGFPNHAVAAQMASFSVKEFGWFVLFLILTVALMAAILAGRFVGKRARFGGILMGCLLLADLSRADLPWIVFQNYVTKYASNPVLDFLANNHQEHRVALFPLDQFMGPAFKNPSPENRPLVELHSELAGLYRIEWAQHHFQYYNIQALEDVQRPREAPDFKAYERGPVATLPFRHWELTNTKYFLAPAVLGHTLAQQGFREALGFNIVPKPGVTEARAYEDLTAVLATNNPQFAVFEFTNALPRAKLFSNWQVVTNDNATLNTLVSTNFNPHETVLLAEPISLTPSAASGQKPGSVEITHYAPKNVQLRATADVPSVLLLNDKYDGNWKVTVDGKPAPLLRANFIMRAVALPPGNHEIVFQFAPSIRGLYVSLSAIVLGLLLVGLLAVVRNGENECAASCGVQQPEGTKRENYTGNLR